MTTLEDVLILIPVFDDWESFARLLVDLDAALAAAGDSARVLAVDDGSTTALGRRCSGRVGRRMW